MEKSIIQRNNKAREEREEESGSERCYVRLADTTLKQEQEKEQEQEKSFL